jgi:phosphate:Na+ symporter
MNLFIQALEILGSLGVFLFGMKIMSEALQKVAGERLKSLLSKMTTNRVSGVGTGFLTTSIIQSSSATTVMVVSFVNARLLNLRQAIGVIMGANIGTTVTGWLVALIGFKIKLSAMALPIVGIGMAMTFMKGARRKQWGEVLLGFGILFLGLHLLKSSIPNLDEGQLAFVRHIGGEGMMSALAFVGIGTLLTIVLQSSSATMTLTLTMTAAGWITFDNAAAMILGENIGTTITALLASIGTSVNARRSALAHTTFNIFGVIWALLLMNWVLLPVVDAIVPADPWAIPVKPDVVTAHLAMFHSFFNITNTCLMLPFVNVIAKFVTRLAPGKEGVEAPMFGKFISTPVVGTPELQLVQVREEMRHMTDVVTGMFKDAMKALTDPDANRVELVERIRSEELRTDGLEREITEVLRKTGRESTSGQVARDIANMTYNAHRLERIGDHCERLANIAERISKADDRDLEERSLQNLRSLQPLVEAALANARAYFEDKGSLDEARKLEAELDEARDRIRLDYVEAIQNNAGEPISDLWFLDALNHVEEIGDACYGVAMQLRPPGTRRRDRLAAAAGRA